MSFESDASRATDFESDSERLEDPRKKFVSVNGRDAVERHSAAERDLTELA